MKSWGCGWTGQVAGQYIQLPRIAKDFANYLELYYKYQRTYHVDEVLRGEWKPVTVSELRAAPFDEKLSVMGLLLSRMSESARRCASRTPWPRPSTPT